MGARFRRERSADTYTGVADILPSQYFSRFRGPCEGEKALMMAVLEEAIHTYKKHALAKHPHKKAIFREAQRWVSSDDFGWPFAYRRICEALSIDPGGIRKGLEKWLSIQREEASKNIPPKNEETSQCITGNDK